MRRTPRIFVIEPRIRAGLDGYKTIKPVRIGQRSSSSGEVRIEWCWMVVSYMSISAGSVRLPDLNQAVRQRVAISIEHATAHDDALADRLCRMLNCEVIVG